MSASIHKNIGLPLAGISVALALVIAFQAGRRTAGPVGGSPAEHEAPQAAEKHAEKHAEKSDEKGVVRFGPEALRRAGIQVRAVSYASLPSQLALTGTIEPNLAGVVRVTPRVAGKVIQLDANVGDPVRAGQVLAILSSTELAEAQGAFRQAGARIALAQSNLKRQRQLAGLGEFGRHPLEEARRESVAAQGEIKIAQNEVAAARNEVAEARSEQASRQSDLASTEAEATSSQSEIVEAEGGVKALQAALAQAQTGVEVTQSRFNRANVLLADQLISRQDWEQARADAKRSTSDVDAARANLSQGQAKVETARAHLRSAQAKARAMQSQVQQAGARIETALSRQAQAEERLAAGRQRAEIAAQSLSREEKIFHGGFFTSKEIVEAEAALRQAQLEQRAAADRVRLLGGTPGGGNTLPVTAPIAGRVTERTVTAGETVTPEKALLTVVNLNTVWVQLGVHQRDLPLVRVGQAVAVTSETAPGRTFTGAVSYIGDHVDETTRTVKVRCVVQNAAGTLKPQTFVRGRIRTEVRHQALVIPRDAVQELEGQSVLFVQGEQPGEFQVRKVEVEDTSGAQVVVTSGLKPGDRIVTAGAFVVKSEAMKSELKEE